MATSPTPPLTAQITIADLLARHPHLAFVFFRYRMACVGCVSAPFETLGEVAAIYGIPLERLLEALQRAEQKPLLPHDES